MEYVNIMEAARRCAVSDKTIRRAIRKGTLPARFPKPNRCEIAVCDLERFTPRQASGQVQAEVESRIAALERRVQVLEHQVQGAVSKGATALTGGKKLNSKGFFFQPTVLVNVNHGMNVMKDESFGPVIGIMKVKDDNEAIELMKDTEYGLTASVYSADRKRAENILREIDTGTGYWNCCDRVSAALPWSGRRHSGFGVTLSHAGLRAFTKPKGYHLKS